MPPTSPSPSASASACSSRQHDHHHHHHPSASPSSIISCYGHRDSTDSLARRGSTLHSEMDGHPPTSTLTPTPTPSAGNPNTNHHSDSHSHSDDPAQRDTHLSMRHLSFIPTSDESITVITPPNNNAHPHPQPQTHLSSDAAAARTSTSTSTSPPVSSSPPGQCQATTAPPLSLVAQELQNIAAVRRISLDVDGVDPDLHAFASFESIPALAPTKSRSRRRKHRNPHPHPHPHPGTGTHSNDLNSNEKDGNGNGNGNGSHSSDDSGSFSETDSSSSSDAAARLYWVPAAVHPELAPNAFRKFINGRVDAMRRRREETETLARSNSTASSTSSRSITSAGDTLSAGGGLQRRKSLLSRQVEPGPGPAPASTSQGKGEGEEKNMDAVPEDKDGERDASSIDPFHPLLSSSSAAASSPSSAHPNIAAANAAASILAQDIDDRPILPPHPPTAAFSLRRSTRTNYRKGSMSAGSRVVHGRSRPGRHTGLSAGGQPADNAAGVTSKGSMDSTSSGEGQGQQLKAAASASTESLALSITRSRSPEPELEPGPQTDGSLQTQTRSGEQHQHQHQHQQESTLHGIAKAEYTPAMDMSVQPPLQQHHHQQQQQQPAQTHAQAQTQQQPPVEPPPPPKPTSSSALASKKNSAASPSPSAFTQSYTPYSQQHEHAHGDASGHAGGGAVQPPPPPPQQQQQQSLSPSTPASKKRPQLTRAKDDLRSASISHLPTTGATTPGQGQGQGQGQSPYASPSASWGVSDSNLQNVSTTVSTTTKKAEKKEGAWKSSWGWLRGNSSSNNSDGNNNNGNGVVVVDEHNNMEKEKEKKKGRAKSHGHGHHRKSSEDEESFADEISSSLHGEGVKKRESLVFDRNEIKLDDEDVQINTNGPQTHHSLTGSVSGIGFGKKKNKDKDKDTNTSPGLFYSLFGSGKKKASNGNNTSDASHSSHSLTSFGHKKLGSKSNAPSSPDTSKGHRRGLGSSTAAINNILTKKPTNDTPRTASGTTNPSGASDTVEMYLLRPDIDYPWTRFTLAEEREIYRLAHKKLSSQGRPLLPQVLLSNFMYSYLAKVQAANPHMALPTSAAQNSAMKRSQQEQQEAAMQMQMQEREQQQQQQLAQGYLADTTDGNGGDAYSAQVQAHMAQWAGMDAAKYDELERKELEQWENEQTEQQLSGMGMIEVGPAGMVNEAGQAMTWEDMYAYEDAYYGYGEAEGEGEEDSGAGTSIGHGGQQGQQQQQQQQQQVYVRTSSYG